jgi:hypothetical protein
LQLFDIKRLIRVAPVASGTTEHNEAQQIPQKSRNLMVFLTTANLFFE